MRLVAPALVASIALAGVAHATQDDYRDIVWVAAWADADAVVVERVSYSPEADGHDRRTWWSIQQPAGVEQAVIQEPYSRKPWLKRPKASMVPLDKLEALVAGLGAANSAKPRPKQKAVRVDILPTLGVTGLTAAKTCPAKVRVGKKVVIVSLGEIKADAGPSVVRVDRTMDMDLPWSTHAASDGPSMKPTCFPHAGGVVVRIRLHVSYEGDNYEHRVVFLPGSQLP